MNVRIILILLYFAGVIVSCGCLQPYSENSEKLNTNTSTGDQKIIFTDSAGQIITLSHPANRILPLSSQSAELLISIGAGSKIVGVTDSIKNRTDIMQRLSPAVPSVGSGSVPDIERIVQLKPDVIITYESYKPVNFDKLIESNITVIVLDCYKLETISNDARILGMVSGNVSGAARYTRFNEHYQNLVQSRIANLSPEELPRVYGEYSDYTVIVRNSAGGQVVAALHGKNVYGNTSIPEWPIVSPEWILNQDPDIIIRSGENSGSGITLETTYNSFITRPGFNELRAVKMNRFYVYDKDLLSGPRTAVGLVYLAKAFYPERFSEVDPDEIRMEYFRDFGFGNESKEWIYPPFPKQLTVGRLEPVTSNTTLEKEATIP